MQKKTESRIKAWIGQYLEAGEKRSQQKEAEKKWPGGVRVVGTENGQPRGIASVMTTSRKGGILIYRIQYMLWISIQHMLLSSLHWNTRGWNRGVDTGISPFITANNSLTEFFFPPLQLWSLLVQRSWNLRKESPPGDTKTMPLN